MFHQTLFPFSSSSSPSPPPFPLSSGFFNSSSTSIPLPLAPLHQPAPPPLHSSSCPQVERELAMEDCGLWKKGMASEEEVERGNFPCEGFSVDELLNLGDDADSDKAAEEESEAVEEVRVEAKLEAAEVERQGVDSDTSSSSSSSSTSALSFETPRPPPPLAEITLPAHDAEELEWVSLIMEDSMSEIPPCPCPAHYASTPPDGLNEASAGAAAAEEAEKGAALSRSAASKSKRSKRSRSAAAWSMSALHPFADSPSVTASAASSSASSSHVNTSTSCLIYTRHPTGGGDQSFLLYGVPPHPARNPASKKRGRKPKHSAPRSGSGERRCSHCGAQKTPQWRAGPLGAKTLCNACGVRFKSGRLLPEYRPACSPTFVSHIHSNSHRKVLEMRRKKEAEIVLSPAGPPVASF